MKYYKTKNQFSNSTKTLTLNVNTLEGRSYEWYSICRNFNGVVVLNTYNYSSTTCKHIIKVRSVLSGLNQSYIELEAPRGLQDLDESLKLYENRIEALELAIAKPKTRKSTNEARQFQIDQYYIKLGIIRNLIERGV